MTRLRSTNVIVRSPTANGAFGLGGGGSGVVLDALDVVEVGVAAVALLDGRLVAVS
jgi:hypothetical protein